MTQDSHKPTIINVFLRTVTSTSLVNISGLGMLYVSQVVIARLLGAENYGVYHYVLSWLLIAVLVGKLGMDVVIQRYVPQYSSQGNWGLFRGVLINAFLSGTLSSLTVIAAIYLALTTLLIKTIPPATLNTFLAALVALPFWTLYKIAQSALLALKRPALSQITDGLIQPALLLALLYAFHVYTQHSVSATTAMGLYASAWFVALLIGSALLAVNIPPQAANQRVRYHRYEWYHYAFPALITSAVTIALNNADVIMIGILRNTTEAGIYAVSSRIATLISIGLILINMVLAPYISEYYHNGRLAELRNLTTLGTRIAAICSVIVMLFLSIFHHTILGFFGNAFRTGSVALFILEIGYFFNVSCGSVGFLMSLTGHQKPAAIILGLSALLNIATNFVLIPKYGIDGAAVANVISMIAWNAGMVTYVLKVIRINPTLLSTGR